MPIQIECDDCGLTVLGYDVDGPTPIGREACPKCDGTSFSVPD